jgi:DNA-binding beta-propeller fold protein YncE
VVGGVLQAAEAERQPMGGRRERSPGTTRRWRALRAAILAAALLGAATPLLADELLYVAEGNRLRVLALGEGSAGAPPLPEKVLIERASLDAARGRDVNGMVCPLPDGSGDFVAGEDTGQPRVPGGWGIFDRRGVQRAKLTATAFASEYPEPYGCAFDERGRLFTSEIGDKGFGHANGQLILWFPPEGGFAAGDAGYCKLAVDLGTPGGVAIDPEGRVYVATSSGLEILRFSPPFPSAPTAAGGCGARDASGAPLADTVLREVFASAHWRAGLLTWSGLAFSPRGTLYAASVATGRIGELDRTGRLLRLVLVPEEWLPPYRTGTPQGLAVDTRGQLYYADLDLRWSDWTLRPGADGKVWRIPIAADGTPGAPELLRRGLAFPDGVRVLEGRLADLPPSREAVGPASGRE